eukprot:SAG31_NODE_1227_length_9239_cov_29.041904_2_plen_434_part_00
MAAPLSPHPWGVNDLRYNRADARLQSLLDPQRAAEHEPSMPPPSGGLQTPQHSREQQSTAPSLNSAEYLRSPLSTLGTASLDPKMAALLNNQHEASPRLLESSRAQARPYPALGTPADRSVRAWSSPSARSPRTPAWQAEPIVAGNQKESLVSSANTTATGAHWRRPAPQSIGMGFSGRAHGSAQPDKNIARVLSRPEQEVSRLLYGSASIAPTASPSEIATGSTRPTTSIDSKHPDRRGIASSSDVDYRSALRTASAAEPDAHWARMSSYNQRYWAKLGSYRALWLRQNTPGLATTLSSATKPAGSSVRTTTNTSSVRRNVSGAGSNRNVAAISSTNSIQESLLTREQARALAEDMGVTSPGERFDRLFNQMAMSGGGMIDAASCARLIQFMQSSIINTVDAPTAPPEPEDTPLPQLQLSPGSVRPVHFIVL